MTNSDKFEQIFGHEVSHRLEFFVALAERMHDATKLAKDTPSKRYIANARDYETLLPLAYIGLFAKIDEKPTHIEIGVPIEEIDAMNPVVDTRADFVLMRYYDESGVHEQKVPITDENPLSTEAEYIQSILGSSVVVPIREAASY